MWTDEIKGNNSVYKKHAPWIFNYITSLFKGGLHHTRPLMEIINRRFDKKRLQSSGVELKIGAVGLKSGKYVTITEKDVSPEWIMASSAMPVFFDPVEINGEKYVDGGVRNITPICDVIAEEGV